MFIIVFTRAPPLVPILSQINPVLTTQFFFFKIHFNIIRPFLKLNENIIVTLHIRDSIVGIATGYGLNDRGVGTRLPVESRIFSSPRLPDRLRGPHNLLYIGYRELFLRG
jgi:hypothetical protein